jgi:cbb3-type cytochrome oxidase maturation protein
MSVIILLIVASLTLGLIFLGAFIWSVRSGQYEDTMTPSIRVLLDDTEIQTALPKTGGQAVPLPVTQNKAKENKTGAVLKT